MALLTMKTKRKSQKCPQTIVDIVENWFTLKMELCNYMYIQELEVLA